MNKYLEISSQLFRGHAGRECKSVVWCQLPVPTADALKPKSACTGGLLVNTAVNSLQRGFLSCRPCFFCSWRLKTKQIVEAAEQVSLHLTGMYRNRRLWVQMARFFFFCKSLALCHLIYFAILYDHPFNSCSTIEHSKLVMNLRINLRRLQSNEELLSVTCQQHGRKTHKKL